MDITLNNITKTKVDTSMTITVVFLGLVIFVLPVLSNENLRFHKAGLLFLSFGFILIFLGLWKYEYYKYNSTQITKYNFLGLLSRNYNLNEMESYKNRFIHLGSYKNPMAILSLFKKNSKKFIEFNLFKVYFNNGTKLKIDERVMSNQDFLTLKKTIKNNKLHKKM